LSCSERVRHPVTPPRNNRTVRAPDSIDDCRTERPQLVPEILRGIVEFGLYDAADSETALELGLSIWMRRAGADLGSLRTTLIQLRRALLTVENLDRASEPLPFVGVSVRRDVLSLASYLGGLLERVAVSTGTRPGDVVERVIRAVREEMEPSTPRPAGAAILRLVRP